MKMSNLNYFDSKGRTLIAVFLFVLISLNASAGSGLKFKDQKFKIIQFTDLHYVHSDKHKAQNDSTIELMRLLIEEEKPDLVVFTGDVVVSSPALEGWDRVTQPMTKLQVPFAVNFGNHDTETDVTTSEILEHLSKNPMSVTENQVKGISGQGNCSLPIQSSNGKQDEMVVYLFDSKAYSDHGKVSGYGWVKHDQIDWYRKTSQAYANKNKRVVPALAFFHIPLPEYAIVREQEATLGNNTERVHAPTMNTGLLSAFVEMSDVKGVFVGHDHNNDFIGGIFGVALVYGRKTGYVPAYTEILDRGARVIELTEGADFFETYIRTRSDKLLEYTFPY
ncbi:metallophosphoesterase family protein [Sunxiuqinia elliptica]|nr:metallophosphoesterase family protein [Sunxiuqinia elliptica]